MILYTKLHTEVSNDVTIWHENGIERNIRISVYMPYCSDM